MIANDASNKTHLFHFLQIIILNRSVKINPYTDSPSNYRKCSYIKICVLNPICRTGVALPCGAPAGLAAICCANCNVRLWRQQSSGLLRTNLSSPTAQQKYGVGFCLPHIFGTPEGTRTPNPRNRNPMLYPLSHRRICIYSLCIIASFFRFVKRIHENIFPKSQPFLARNGCFLSNTVL